ncbi:Protein kinase domain-containing protein [Friedmanniella luteola]|uniref:non-specific serine/threonine protein kinase n=1 Tax=Friedmanniella luteola TaxID=546871 RepID=A0A1H1ZQX5_9ACTN|nr:serine/threonine-protein kinase [Friedmanniella luteola]SDT36050.1 Protein kinase domain-containing protein [Friedmanniella luteola]
MEHPDIGGLEGWRLLAHGRSAAVWEARQPALDRRVAVKVCTGPVDETVQQAFLRLTARAARLAWHPGVVTVHDAGVLPGGRPYVVEDLVTGGALARWLELPERCGQERVRRLGAVVADALATAHAAGVVHGRVSPGNILLDEHDDPVLVDFGAAVVHAAGRDGRSSAEPGYAAPEARRGAGAAGDVYGLAATLYALLTGQPPPQSVGPRRAARSSGRVAVPPLWDVQPALRASLVAALDGDPAARPSALELRDRLRGRSEPVGSAVDSSAAPARSRRRAGVLVGSVALVLVTTGGAWLLGGPASSGPPATRATSPAPDPAAGAPQGGLASTPAGVRLALLPPAGPAEPFKAVQLRGTHSGGTGSTFLRVQRWERGTWRAFPLPTRADGTGWFTTYVELGQPGRYRLRVLDPEAGVASEPVLLVVGQA